MKTISFYAGADEMQRIKAEQERFAAMGIRLSKSAAIRALILRASESSDQALPVPQAEALNPENGGFWPVQAKGKVYT
jgi:hypothetical protein